MVAFALDSAPTADLGSWLLSATLSRGDRALRRLGVLGDGQSLNLCFAHDLVDDVALLVTEARVTRSGSVFNISFPVDVIGADTPDAWSASFIADSRAAGSGLGGALA